jgi:hypothetical protein
LRVGDAGLHIGHGRHIPLAPEGPLHVRIARFALVIAGLALLAGCNDYRVRFLYPREGRGAFFNERPETSLYVAEPVDLRPSAEREGKGWLVTRHFPADDHLEQPAARITMRALLQDLNQTQLAVLVRNPDNADYRLESRILNLTTELHRPLTAWAVPLASGVAVGALASIGSDGGTSHFLKTGAVGVIIGTMFPAPADVRGIARIEFDLVDTRSGEVVWNTTCEGEFARSMAISMASRDDQKLVEDFLPKALKRANACAVGQLYAYLQDHQVAPAVPAGG